MLHTPHPQKWDFGLNSDYVMIWSYFGPKNRLIFGAANYTFLESLGPGQYNKNIFRGKDIWTKSWFGPILVQKIDWSSISTTIIFGARYYTFLEFLGPGQYNKTIFKMFYNCFKWFCTSVNIEMLYSVIFYVTYC